MSATAVDISADLRSAGDQFGWICLSSAAAPDTCGAAMLVPDTMPKPRCFWRPSPSAKPDERMLTPGATISGFRLCWKVGPRELNAASTSGAWSITRGRGSICTRAAPAALLYQSIMARPTECGSEIAEMVISPACRLPAI